MHLARMLKVLYTYAFSPVPRTGPNSAMDNWKHLSGSACVFPRVSPWSPGGPAGSSGPRGPVSVHGAWWSCAGNVCVFFRGPWAPMGPHGTPCSPSFPCLVASTHCTATQRNAPNQIEAASVVSIEKIGPHNVWGEGARALCRWKKKLYARMCRRNWQRMPRGWRGGRGRKLCRLEEAARARVCVSCCNFQLRGRKLSDGGQGRDGEINRYWKNIHVRKCVM